MSPEELAFYRLLYVFLLGQVEQPEYLVEDRFGNRIHDRIIGSAHLHLFEYTVNGTKVLTFQIDSISGEHFVIEFNDQPELGDFWVSEGDTWL